MKMWLKIFLDFLCQIIWKSGIVTIKAWNVHIGPTEHNYTLSNMFTMYRLYIQGTLYVVRCALTPLYKMFWFALNGSLKFSTETQVEKISPPNFTTWRRQVANFNPHHFPDNWIEIRISADSCSSDFYFFSELSKKVVEREVKKQLDKKFQEILCNISQTKK